MSKWLVVRQTAMSGDVDNIYIIEANSENEAVFSIKDSGGLVSIAINIDEVSLPYKVYRKL